MVTGPAPLTLDDVARELSSATGRSVEFVAVPDDAARAALLGDGSPDWLVDNLLTLFGMLRQGVADQTTDTHRDGPRPSRHHRVRPRSLKLLQTMTR